jgi:ABC-type multidrug transport system fused ATPase/permease subunit
VYGSKYVQGYFLNTSRELKRLDGVTRTPFLNLVGETINGIESIRSFRMSNEFSQKCRDLLDHNAKFFFVFNAANEWFAMRLDWLVTSVVAVVSVTCVISRDSIGSANVGIALTYAVQLTLQFQRLLTLASNTENYMTSYERIAHFGTLEEEGCKKIVAVTNPPDESWPTKGTIEFSEVFLRYRDGLDFVLRGVTFSVRDGEKIGVCGRTGSGKSTLMNALFRTVEIAQGVIRIDGVDITSVTLKQLRSHLTIIPQDPVLFSGSLRENLDPFNEKSDEELFSALRKVHLIEDVGRWGQGLSYEVSEKGENLSVGQRQLICIARALLRESRIVVLDEATASVDQELDRLIQVAVKECFRGRTSLTIAHRLETIADSDRILVMEQGLVAEFDTPANLLAKRDGLFASLMQSTQHDS